MRHPRGSGLSFEHPSLDQFYHLIQLPSQVIGIRIAAIFDIRLIYKVFVLSFHNLKLEKSENLQFH